jgi:AcrR family transcriptional regulator
MGASEARPILLSCRIVQGSRNTTQRRIEKKGKLILTFIEPTFIFRTMVHNMNGYSNQLSRKDREMALRREAILDAATQIFQSEGYTNATMALIASKAEFGVGTLYQFFPSKQNLFTEVIVRGAERFKQGLKDAVGEKTTWQDELRSFVEYYLMWIDKNPEFHRLIYEIFYSPIPEITSHIFEVFKNIHKEILQMLQGIFSHANNSDMEFDPDLMSLLILGMIHAICDNLFLGMLNKAPKDYIPSILGFIIGGENSESE